ncbi:polysaccharide deacetylase family protein [Kribbella catacumbae]|uniref:polysaccharide deacetylase family protein n=1 Tax=Kribbella catacumbae TaxID=460086 RepID=UPI00036FB656|nr:polysaccharide deacetylase family protein [Kribbella catacumbae]
MTHVRPAIAVAVITTFAAIAIGSLMVISGEYPDSRTNPGTPIAIKSQPPATPSILLPSPTATSSKGEAHPIPSSNNPLAAAAHNAKVVFLTFDDGPDPYWTPKILQVLAKYGAKATFFQRGDMALTYPGVRDQVLAAGHTIGNHSVSHRQLTVLPAEKRRREISDGPKSRCFRPPFGATNRKVRSEIRAAGMTQILWDVDPQDWKRPGAAAIADNILHFTHRGSVVLLHDGGGDRGQTVAALDRVLRTLKSQGYKFPAMNC